MDEKKEEEAETKTTEERKATEAVQGDDHSKDRETPKTTPLIDIANAAAERMEKANEETARLQAVQAERDQRIALGGRAEAGQEAQPKEETPKEYAERKMRNE